MSLADEFENEVLEGCKVLSRKHHYTPTYFIQMVHERGAVNAAKALLHSKEPSEGLFTLWKLGRLDLSVEAMALMKKYRSLFTADERATAKKRLDDLNFTLPEDW